MPRVYVQESGKTAQSAVKVSYILRVCVQLYEHEGSLCVCFSSSGLQQHSPTLLSERGSSYWSLFYLGPH